MQVIIVEDAAAVAYLGAQMCRSALENKPDTVFGLATGSTPVAMYNQLIDLTQNSVISFCKARSFNLDEYIGLSANHPQSYRWFMNQRLFNHIDIDINNTYVPDGAIDPQLAARQYERLITQSGGIDLQILGLGRNGHIGFNEPSSSLVSRTRIKTLSGETVADNSRFFAEGEFQPSTAITMGIGTIMEAKKIVLLATGTEKSNAVKRMVEGALSASCPASALQMHENTTVLLDEEAAGQLSNKAYYQQVQKSTNLLSVGG